MKKKRPWLHISEFERDGTVSNYMEKLVPKNCTRAKPSRDVNKVTESKAKTINHKAKATATDRKAKAVTFKARARAI